MKKFKVLITETLEKIVEVEADNEDEACYITEGMYKREEVVLYPEDITDTAFSIWKDEPIISVGWYDVYTDCIFPKMSPYVPAERYFMAIKGGLQHVYTDYFKLENGKSIAFAWSDDAEKEFGWDVLVKAHFEQHKISDLLYSAILYKRVFPPEEFERLVEKGREYGQN